MTQQPPQMIQWLVSTHDLIKNIDKNLKPADQMRQFADLNHEVLDLLPDEERKGVLKYFFPADAAMSLVSHLLKHLIIADSIGIPFKESVVSRHPEHGKPCYTPPAGSSKSVSFNVSHQAGLVALIAKPQSPNQGQQEIYDVGTDIVCVNERRDFEKIMDSRDPRKGYNDYIDMHAEVFSAHEISALKMVEVGKGVHDHRRNVERDVRKGLRRFFALWCLREAYVKITGEALLAEWLQKLEFRTSPVPEEVGDDDDDKDGEVEGRLVVGEEKGAEEGEFEIYFRGERVRNVEMRIVSVGKRYMVASAVRRRDGGPVDVQWTGLEEIGVEEVVRRAKAAV